MPTGYTRTYTESRERERESFILFTEKEKERSLGKEKNLPTFEWGQMKHRSVHVWVERIKDKEAT
jgi:hypothetical protein